jgi:hypothetical protein
MTDQDPTIIQQLDVLEATLESLRRQHDLLVSATAGVGGQLRAVTDAVAQLRRTLGPRPPDTPGRFDLGLDVKIPVPTQEQIDHAQAELERRLRNAHPRSVLVDGDIGATGEDRLKNANAASTNKEAFDADEPGWTLDSIRRLTTPESPDEQKS